MAGHTDHDSACQYDVLALKPSKHVRIAALDKFWDRTITVGSAGKNFSATGWRVGWLVGPANLIRACLAASTRVTFCTNSPLQEATAVGFERAEEEQFFESQSDVSLGYQFRVLMLLAIYRLFRSAGMV